MLKLFVAISDGILNNDAFKHTTGDANNDTWSQLLLDLKFFDDTDDHIMDLRRRFVFGAADWMAGNHGSMQNDKLLFGYNDSQWEYIWNTMLEDGAWAVPSIRDESGNIIKENFAPEILIKFIAHDLRWHIIVFDLVLDSIQFISGNHLKANNVVFDSPLMIYSTGSHFQSVLQVDHEFFLNFSKDLDVRNHAINAKEGSLSSEPPTSETEVNGNKLIVNPKSKITSKENDGSKGKRFKADLQQCSYNESRSAEESNFDKTQNIKKKDWSTDQKQTNKRKETQAESELRKKVNRENMRGKIRQEKEKQQVKSCLMENTNDENLYFEVIQNMKRKIGHLISNECLKESRN
jgi:hypothetical protein